MPDGLTIGMRLAKIARATRSSLKLINLPANRRHGQRSTRHTRCVIRQFNGTNDLPRRIIPLYGVG